MLDGGDYYLAVTSLGNNPVPIQTGTGACDLTLITRGELPVNVLPALNVAAPSEVAYDLEPTEVAAYEFTIPERASSLTPYGFSIGRRKELGLSNLTVRRGNATADPLPVPPGVGVDGYFGGVLPDFEVRDDLSGWVVYQAVPGKYRVMLRSTAAGTSYSRLTGTLSIQLLDSGSGIPTLKFDGENIGFSGIGVTENILPFRVIVPDEPNWQAWGLRLDGQIKGVPAVYVRRDQAVSSAATSTINSDRVDWPTLSQWTQMEDYTKLNRTVAGSLTGSGSGSHPTVFCGRAE